MLDMTTTPDETPATEPDSSPLGPVDEDGYYLDTDNDMEMPADWLPEGNAEAERSEILVVATLTLTVGDEVKTWQAEIVTTGKAMVAAKNAVNIVAEDGRDWVYDEDFKGRR